MRGRLAGSLALVIALLGVAIGPAPISGLSSLGHNPFAAAAAPRTLPARQVSDVGGGLIRKGPFVNSISSPTITVQILAKYDIFLAGMTYPFAVHGRLGSDLAGPASPACLSVSVPRGSIVSITTLHGTAFAPRVSMAKDANGRVSQVILAGPAERGAGSVGVSSIRAPVDGLVGVFIGSRPNTGRAPSILDYRTAAERDARIVRPALNQVFFIGKGVTSKGGKKSILTPPGAKELCLASLNNVGASGRGRGVILAFVTGTESIPNLFAPVPSGPAIASVSPTPIIVPTNILTSTVFPTDTATPTFPPTGTPAPSATPTVTATFAVVVVNGTPFLINGQGTPVSSNGAPLPPGSVPPGLSGAVAATAQAGATAASQASAGITPPTSTTVPSATFTPTPTATRTTTATTTATATATATSPTTAGIPITLANLWTQFQFDQSRGGYPLVTGQGGTNSNSSACSTTNFLCAQNLKPQWQSTPIANNAAVLGGPVLGNENLYFTTANGAVHCIDANTGFANVNDDFPCRDGFNTVSLGPFKDDNVPVVDPANNVLYFLSHNPPVTFTTSVTNSQAGGSLTAYNASTGAPIGNFDNNPSGFLQVHPFLPSAMGIGNSVGPVALAVHNNICYVPTQGYTTSLGAVVPPQLHYLSCGPTGTGLDTLNSTNFPPNNAVDLNGNTIFANGANGIITLMGAPLSGVAIDPVNKLVLVPVSTPGGVVLEAFCTPDNGNAACTPAMANPPNTPSVPFWSVTLPGSSGALIPNEAFTPAVGLVGVTGETTFIAVPNGLFAISDASQNIIWSVTTAVTPRFASGATAFTTFIPVSMPSYDPADNLIFIGATVTIGTQTVVPVEVAISPGATPPTTLQVQWDFTQQGMAAPIGAPISVNGGIAGLGSVMFFTDQIGNVFALSGPSGALLKSIPNTNTLLIQPGATLVTSLGHLFFGTTNGSIFNYSEPPS